MKEIQKYIRTIIVLSSISLFGFLIIQYYWAKNNFEEKKLNIQNVISICNQEIIEEIEDLIVEKSTKLIIPKSFSSINSINKYLPIGKFFTRYFFIYRKQKKYNKKLTEIKVESAFGGIGIYKVNKDLFKNLEYSIDLKFGNTSCEHIKFNSFFKNKIIYPLWIIPSPLEHIEFKLISFNNKIKYIFKTIIGDIKNII